MNLFIPLQKNRKRMKRFLFLSMLIFIAIMIYVSVHEKENDQSLPQKLEQAMAKYASDLHATQQQKGDGCFILSGHLYTETGH